MTTVSVVEVLKDSGHAVISWKTICLFPRQIDGNSPTASQATCLPGPVAGIDCNIALCFLTTPFILKQSTEDLIQLLMSVQLLIFCQYYFLSILCRVSWAQNDMCFCMNNNEQG